MNDAPQDALERTVVLDPAAAGKRLDVALAAAVPDLSRSYIARLLKDGAILVDGQEAKPKRKIRGGEIVAIELPEPEVIEAVAENIPLEVLYEDADVIAVHKPAGMVSHPSMGHARGTLVNALLGHCTDLSSINGSLRPGIVHRLDGDTTGAIVSAKNDAAHRGLQEQFMARTVRKRYLALCHGLPAHDTFECDGRIGRHPVRRKEMAVLRGEDEGRAAYTSFRVLQRFPDAMLDIRGARKPAPVSLILARPKTGRTHQIRVHLTHCGHPILADKLYGREAEIPAWSLTRQALHAWRLEVAHPRTGAALTFSAPLAEDMRNVVHTLGGRDVTPEDDK